MTKKKLRKQLAEAESRAAKAERMAVGAMTKLDHERAMRDAAEQALADAALSASQVSAVLEIVTPVMLEVIAAAPQLAKLDLPDLPNGDPESTVVSPQP